MKNIQLKGGKMKRKYILGIVAFSVILLLGISSVSAFGFGNWFTRDTTQTDMQEEQESLQTAIENSDYDTWKTLMESKITEENFNKIVEKYNEMNEEDSEKDNLSVHKINEKDEEVIEAIENSDYDTWKTLMESKITEENFNKIVEGYQNMKEKQEERDSQETGYDSEDISDKEQFVPQQMGKRNHGGPEEDNNFSFGMNGLFNGFMK